MGKSFITVITKTLQIKTPQRETRLARIIIMNDGDDDDDDDDDDVDVEEEEEDSGDGGNVYHVVNSRHPPSNSGGFDPDRQRDVSEFMSALFT